MNLTNFISIFQQSVDEVLAQCTASVAASQKLRFTDSLIITDSNEDKGIMKSKFLKIISMNYLVLVCLLVRLWLKIIITITVNAIS